MKQKFDPDKPSTEPEPPKPSFLTQIKDNYLSNIFKAKNAQEMPENLKKIHGLDLKMTDFIGYRFKIACSAVSNFYDFVKNKKYNFTESDPGYRPKLLTYDKIVYEHSRFSSTSHYIIRELKENEEIPKYMPQNVLKFGKIYYPEYPGMAIHQLEGVPAYFFVAIWFGLHPFMYRELKKAMKYRKKLAVDESKIDVSKA